MDTDINRNSLIPELRSRVASLDGLRALSIAMVLFNHAQVSCNFPAGTPAWFGWLFHGQLGVRIFFVISGFIITLLILREERNTGVFSVKNFYLRRIIRILPVYYLFIIAVIIINNFHDLRLNDGELAAAITFTTGWWKNGTWILGHTWSLSVEEQFYLLWPCVIFFVTSPSKRIIVSCCAVALYPVMRIIVYKSSLSLQRGYIFIGSGDSILFGCLLAFILFYHQDQVRKYFSSYIIVVRIFLIFLIWGSTALQSKAMLGMITVPFSNTVESIAITWLIASFILNRDWIHWLLNTKAMIFIGTISYSWYIWQQLFLFECGRYFSADWFRFPINIAFSFLAACISYYLVEKTFERLKKKVVQ